jgi:biopolymer transport protein ExbD
MLFRPPSDKSFWIRNANANHFARAEPEINLIPFIDVLLVILIFLMISTTFTKFQEIAITLPSASGAEP